VADEELRGRESRAKPELRPRTSPDPLALLSAFCAASQPKMGAAPQAEKFGVADEELRGSWERELSQASRS
jgi:hypothetical protein